MVKYRKDQIVTVAVITAVLLVGVWYTLSVLSDKKAQQARDNPATKALSVSDGQTAYTDVEGSEISLDNHLGKVLVVNVWASWSPDSADELSNLAQLANDYQSKNLKILAINRGEPRVTAQRFLRTIGVTDVVQLVLDKDDHFYRSIQGYAMPETIVYNQKGNIVYHARGRVNIDTLRNYVDDALNE